MPLVHNVLFTATDANSIPRVGWKLFTYSAGTTTPLATYTDSTGGTTASNPLLTDSNGQITVWLASALAYKFVLTDPTGVTEYWSADNVVNDQIVVQADLTNLKNAVPTNASGATSFKMGTTGALTLTPGDPAAGPGGNAFDGGIITHKPTGNYQVSAYQVHPTSSASKPEWGPISEFVVAGTTDQATNFSRISITEMGAWAGPALSDAADDIRWQQEAGGTVSIKHMKFTAQYNTSGWQVEYVDMLPGGSIQCFRRTDSPAPTADTLELILEQEKRATANVLTAAGTQDSPSIRWGGVSYDTSLHTARWYAQVDVTSNAGASSLVLFSKLDAGTKTERVRWTDVGIQSGPVGYYFNPANVSTDVNTLDAYAEGTWTPTFSFATPGDVSFSGITVQTGTYTRIGRQVTAHCSFIATITHTTASGNLQCTALPYTTANVHSSFVITGASRWQGITKAGYTDVVAQVGSNSTTVSFNASGSGVARAPVTAADIPTGGVIEMHFSLTYNV